jgi:hypothetical protein
MFRFDATLTQHVAHAFVVLHVLAGDGVLALQVVLADVVIGDFGGEVLRRNGQRGQEVRQRTVLMMPNRSFMA